MRYFAGFTLCLAALLVLASTSLADVTTTPSRLVLTQQTRAGAIKVHNSGGHSLQINASWTAIAQGSDGVLFPVPYGATPADTRGLHLWPQGFTLKPDETRAVFIVLDPRSLIEGERRAHLRIDADRVNGKGPRWGLSLPVFVREDDLPTNVQIAGVRRAGPKNLLVSLLRKGGATPYGKLVVTDDRGNTLGQLGNITLYADQQNIQYEIPLDDQSDGARFVTYLGSGEFENQVFDVSELTP